MKVHPGRTAVASALVFALALGARWAYCSRFPSDVQLADVDARGYHALAVNLIDGRGFSLNTEPPYIPDAIRTPLYPALVALVYSLAGRVPLNVALAQGVLDSLTAVMVLVTASRLAGHGAGLIGGLLYALNPTAIRFANELLTETVLTSLIMGVALAFVLFHSTKRVAWLALTGLLSACAILVKPNVALLPALVAGAVVYGLGRERPTLPAAAIAALALLPVAVCLLVVMPWVVRNRLVFGRWLLSTAFEDNLSHVSAVATLARAGGESVAPWTPRWEEIYADLHARTRAEYAEEFPGTIETAQDADRRVLMVAAVAKRTIAEHPVDFVASHVAGFLKGWVPREHRFWYWALTGNDWEAQGTAEGALGQAVRVAKEDGWGGALSFLWQERFEKLTPPARALWAGWLMSYAVGAGMIAVGGWRLRAYPAMLGLWLALILYVTFVPGPISTIRFRVPVAPLLALLQAAGAATAFCWAIGRRTTRPGARTR